MDMLKYLLDKDLEVKFCNLIRGGVTVELVVLLGCKLPISDNSSFEGTDINDALRNAYNYVLHIS